MRTISLAQKNCILSMLDAGHSAHSIASITGVHTSTISRLCSKECSKLHKSFGGCPTKLSPMLHPLGRQDSEDSDRLIVAAGTGLLRLTYLLFDSEWLWCNLLDFWSGYLLSPFEDTFLNSAQ